MLNQIGQLLAEAGCLMTLLLFPVWGIYSSVQLTREAPDKWWLATPVALALLVILFFPLSEVAFALGASELVCLLGCIAVPCVVSWLLMRPVLQSGRTPAQKILPVGCGLAALTLALAMVFVMFAPWW